MALALVGIIATLVAAVIAAWAAFRARVPVRSNLELVALTIASQGQDASPYAIGPVTVDVMVRNLGGQPAVVKQVRIWVEQAMFFPDWTPSVASSSLLPVFSAPLRSSQSYETELPPPHKAVGHSIDLPVAQSIAAGEADRFQVELTIDTYAYEAIYLLRMSLVYNGDDEHLELPLTVVGSGRNIPVASPERVHADIQGFLDEVEQIRRLAASVPAPDPESEAFAASMLLPWRDGLLRHPDINSWAHPVESGPAMDDYRASIRGKNVYVAVGIGNPKRVVLKSLGELADRYRSLADMIEAAQVRHQPLSDALPLLRCTLAALPQQRILYDAPGARDGQATQSSST